MPHTGEGYPNYKIRNLILWVSSSNPRATNSSTLKKSLLEIAVVYMENFSLINENHIWIYISCIKLNFLVPVKCNMHDIIRSLLFYFIYFLLFIKITFILILGRFWNYLLHYLIINSLLSYSISHKWDTRGCPDDRGWSEIANKCFICVHNM